MRNADPAIIVRPALTSDIPRLCDLLTDLFTIETDFVPDREKQTQGLAMLVADTSGASTVFIAEMDWEVIGMASVQTLVSTAEGGRVGLVEDVIVDHRFRSKGIGTLLLDSIIAWSRKGDLKRLQLLADHTNLPAIDFYVRRRWKATDLKCMRMMLR
jgi:GNAT superfamily N-acetyltransferase